MQFKLSNKSLTSENSGNTRIQRHKFTVSKETKIKNYQIKQNKTLKSGMETNKEKDKPAS